jgi:hypothetical protein
MNFALSGAKRIYLLYTFLTIMSKMCRLTVSFAGPSGSSEYKARILSTLV